MPGYEDIYVPKPIGKIFKIFYFIFIIINIRRRK